MSAFLNTLSTIFLLCLAGYMSLWVLKHQCTRESAIVACADGKTDCHKSMSLTCQVFNAGQAVYCAVPAEESTEYYYRNGYLLNTLRPTDKVLYGLGFSLNELGRLMGKIFDWPICHYASKTAPAKPPPSVRTDYLDVNRDDED